MRLCQLLKLSHAEFIAQRKTVIFSVLGAGVAFIILLTLSFLSSGMENLFLDYGRKATDGAVYLTLHAPYGKDATRYVENNKGEILHQLDWGDIDNYATPMDIFLHYANLSEEQKAWIPKDDVKIMKDDFQLMDIFLQDVAPYHMPFNNDMEMLDNILLNEQVYIVRFPTVKDAYAYEEESSEHFSTVQREEIFSSALRTYSYFRGDNESKEIFRIITLAVATIIVIGTFVYLLDQEMHAMVVYRALGASNRQLLMIALGYLLEVGLAIITFALVGTLFCCLIISAVNGGYIGGIIQEMYEVAPGPILLIGYTDNLLWTIGAILLAAPVSLLLTIDQFSTKRLSQKLKRD